MNFGDIHDKYTFHISGTVYQIVIDKPAVRGNAAFMARLARVMISDVPYRVTHRGNRRGDLFLEAADKSVTGYEVTNFPSRRPPWFSVRA